MAYRELSAALAASVALHLLALTSPGWRLPTEEEAESPPFTLEARLAPQPAAQALAPQSQPKPRSKPGPKRRSEPPPRESLAQAQVPQPAPTDAELVVPALDEGAPPPEEGGAPAVGAEETVPPVEAAPSAAAPRPQAAEMHVESDLPLRGRIRYAVRLGAGEFVVGRAETTWQQDGSAYLLRSVTETVGLAALFRPAKVVQVSEGVIGSGGLVPREFSSTRNDSSEPAEAARFDWQDMRVALSSRGNRREAALTAGAQDLLSVIYQLSLVPPEGTPAEFMVATGKSFNPYTFDALGEEILVTRVGELRALHLKTRAVPGEQTTEIWLALDYRHLPVRVRFTDRKGGVADMVAAEIEFEGIKLAELPQ